MEGEWKDGWIYWLGPIIGGVLASIVHNYIFIPRSIGFPEPMPSEHHDVGSRRVSFSEGLRWWRAPFYRALVGT